MSERIPLGSGANSNRVFIDLTSSDKETQVRLSVLSSSYPALCPTVFHIFYIDAKRFLSFLYLAWHSFYITHTCTYQHHA